MKSGKGKTAKGASPVTKAAPNAKPASAAKKAKRKTEQSQNPADRKKAAAAVMAVNAASGGNNARAAAMAIAIGRGVTMRPSGKWQAQLYFAGQSRYIGVFDTREKATLAYEISREMLKTKRAGMPPGPAAERAVEAARKAAFEGVSEQKPNATAGAASAASHNTRRQTATTTPSVMLIKDLDAAEILQGLVSSPPRPPRKQVTKKKAPPPTAKELPAWVDQNRTTLPAWVEKNRTAYGERLVIAEWELLEYREKNGWSGTDLIHDDDSAVRVVEYFVNFGAGGNGLLKGGEGTTLTGIVHFTPKAESHQGYCHGGSMTSVMDDIVGWAAFVVTGTCRPWSGYTVQINTSLRKPVEVDTWLLVCATVSKVEGRKVSVLATLIDPADDDAIHAEGDGLVVLNKGVMPGT